MKFLWPGDAFGRRQKTIVRPTVARELFELLRTSAVRDHSPEVWQQILSFADRTHLTLHLCGTPGLPALVEQQIDERFSRNAIRRQRLGERFHEIESGLSSRGIPYVLLKGFTHEVGFGLRPGTRAQSDLDFLVSPGDRGAAVRVLETLGYRPHGAARLSAEHESPWVRPFTWSWRGDYFDPDMPIPIELHDSVWSPARDRIERPGVEQFWDRRAPTTISGMQVVALQEEDRIAFAALHALRHILRNDARPSHVFELARLLETRAFSGPTPMLQLIAYRFAQEWFGCRLPQVIEQGFQELPSEVRSWFKSFAWSPIENMTRPNKDVLWLHLSLLKSTRDKWRVAANRLLPLKFPHESPEARFRYHASALLPALQEGARWWWARTTSSTVSHTSD